MAANVFAAAMRQSLAEGNDRNVLMALADCAWRDGVTWILVGDGKDDVEETICRLARVSRQTAWRAIATLRDELREVQTVRVRRGRSFVTVYRVLHGAVDVDYERIPFELPHRFDEPEVQRSKLERSPIEAAQGGMAAGLTSSAQGERFNLQRSDDASTLQPSGVQRSNSEPFNVSDPDSRVKGEPEENRQENQQHQGDAAAALLDGHLRDLGVSGRVRRAALLEPDRAKAWLEVVANEAEVNPAGYFAACFTDGDWPSKRLDRETPSAGRRVWIAETAWRLDPEDAHAIVDDWRDLDDVERADLHEQVDRVRQSRTESEAA